MEWAGLVAAGGTDDAHDDPGSGAGPGRALRHVDVQVDRLLLGGGGFGPVHLASEDGDGATQLHLDIKKLGRFWRPGHRVTGNRQGACEGAGWEFVHLAIDDHSRVAFGTIEADERGISACRALLQALRYSRGLGVTFPPVQDEKPGRD